MSAFSPEIVAAVLHHMNDDHVDDSLLIVRAFADADAESTVMTEVRADGGVWEYVTAGTTHEAFIAWPSGPIEERAAIRREVVVLYDEACAKLGITPRPH